MRQDAVLRLASQSVFELDLLFNEATWLSWSTNNRNDARAMLVFGRGVAFRSGTAPTSKRCLYPAKQFKEKFHI